MRDSTTKRAVNLRFADQSPCGILNSLIARLLFDNQPEAVAILVHAGRYLNEAISY